MNITNMEAKEGLASNPFVFVLDGVEDQEQYCFL